MVSHRLDLTSRCGDLVIVLRVNREGVDVDPRLLDHRDVDMENVAQEQEERATPVLDLPQDPFSFRRRELDRRDPVLTGLLFRP